MSDPTKPKRGRGRPAGATSFARVTLQDLNAHLREKAIVSVSKKWLEEIGLTLEESVTTIKAAPEPQESKPEFTVTDFSE